MPVQPRLPGTIRLGLQPSMADSVGLSIALNGGEHLSRIIEMLVRTLFSEKIMSMAFAAVMLTRVAVVFTRKAKKDLEGAI